MKTVEILTVTEVEIVVIMTIVFLKLSYFTLLRCVCMCVCVCVCVCVLVSHVQLCDPMNCSPLGSSIHGILQARILEWITISFSRESFQPRDQTRISCIASRFFTV